ALLVTLDDQAAAVDDERGALALGGADEALDALLGGGRDDRAHVGVGVVARGDAHRARPLGEQRDQLVGDLLGDDGDRQRHAALAGRPVRGGGQVVGGVGEVGV